MFRFEQLAIWQRACDVGSKLCDLADELDKRKYFRFGEQLRAAALSISNNIAEGSGSDSKADFKSFLNYARRSAFVPRSEVTTRPAELQTGTCASMHLFFRRRGYLPNDQPDQLISELEEISRMISAFRKSL